MTRLFFVALGCGLALRVAGNVMPLQMIHCFRAIGIILNRLIDAKRLYAACHWARKRLAREARKMETYYNLAGHD